MTAGRLLVADMATVAVLGGFMWVGARQLRCHVHAWMRVLLSGIRVPDRVPESWLSDPSNHCRTRESGLG